MSEDTEKEIIELAEAAKAPGTFNILNVIKEASHAKDDVVVYIDENAAYIASKIKDEFDETQELIDGQVDVELNTKKLEELRKKLDEAVVAVQKSKYVFTVSGMSEGKREEIFNKAKEEYPIEFREERNPITQEITRTELESEDRDKYLTNLLWSASVVKITAPDGSIQENISLKDAGEMRLNLPPSVNVLVNQAIEKVRAASALFLMTVDEDFLAKS